ncbi:hypothetical protein GH714_037915 [Hevea brasiliensis]|uniref:Pectinesterase inhibitor domain-containing protein n=1 Tax=Hevea brasiliensis TaxID=3981 RepID=A0A6A6K8K2_HEVBR|nr:hypothetical protein GH714_037915 [Hevea brasiliensis]
MSLTQSPTRANGILPNCGQHRQQLTLPKLIRDLTHCHHFPLKYPTCPSSTSPCRNVACTFLTSSLQACLSPTPPSYTTVLSTDRSDYLQNECLKVPIYEFVGSLKTTIDTIQDVTSTISNFGNFVGNFRLTNAITDCLDLLDFSADELSWSMSASQNPKGKNNSTGDLSSDLRTWLSAAFVNQGTCIDGFEGISSILKSLVAGGLNKITSSVQQLLNKVDSNPKPNYDTNGVALAGRKSSQKDKFPAWFKREDRKLLVINGVTADAIVAADGTGNFTKIMDAVSAAPDYSMRRYVIF